MSFPENFLWGAGTSAFQYEGYPLADGKGWSSADERLKDYNIDANTSIASDGYHCFKEDIALMKELGLRSFRFSLSWSRLFPEGEGELNQKGVEFYNQMIDLLVENNIEPIVTLLHFDIPWALIEKYEGFYDRKCVDAFVKYCCTCFRLYGDRVKYWLTINEQNVMTRMPDMCGLSRDDPILQKKLIRINYNMFIANALVVKACHDQLPNAHIGPCVSYPTLYPETCHPNDIAIAYEAQEMMAFVPMEIYTTGKIPQYYMNYLNKYDLCPEFKDDDNDILNEGICDFIGINWYCTQTVGSKTGEPQFNIGTDVDIKKNPYLEYGEWNWSYDPQAFFMALKQCYDRFHIPIIVCENGWSEREMLEKGTVNDKKRIRYIYDHVNAMEKAIGNGVDIIGYQYWSFIDVLSSSQGFEKRYGLIYVDNHSMNRYKKESFYAYQKLIQNNGKNFVNSIEV